MSGGFRNEGGTVQEYLYDFDVDGGAISPAIDLSAKAGYKTLPNPCIVKQVSLYVVTACTSGGSATLDVGNTTAEAGYMAALAVASLSDQAVIRSGEQAGSLLWDDTNDHEIWFCVNSAADADFTLDIDTATFTAGKVLFMVDYYRPTLD